jgi:hypothetical protein
VEAIEGYNHLLSGKQYRNKIHKKLYNAVLSDEKGGSDGETLKCIYKK